MTAQKAITDLPDGQLTYGQVFTEAAQGKPPADAEQVAVETKDGGSFLLIARTDTRHRPPVLKLWIYDVRASRNEGQLTGDILEMPVTANPYPAVGEPAFEGGPIAVKVHTLEAFIKSGRQGIELGATGRMADSPLQRVSRALAGAGLVIAHVPPAPQPPPTEIL